MTMVLRAKPLSDVVRGIIKRDNGVWLDASDMSTMYQDAAGTTPVTAMEQPVGLWLDKSQGLELGPELITNGDNEAGVATATLDVLTNFTSKIQSSEKAQSGNYSAKLTSNAASGPHYWRLFNIPAGVSLRVTGWVYMPTASTNNQPIKLVDFSDGSFMQVIASSFDNWVYFSVIRAAKITPWVLSIGNNESSNWNGGSIYIDNLSVLEIKGNHATQSITASRPTLSARYNLLTKTEDFANLIWARTGGANPPSSLTTSFAISPNGAQDATLFTPGISGNPVGNTAATANRVFQEFSTSITARYTNSIYVKTYQQNSQFGIYVINGTTDAVRASTVITTTSEWTRVEVSSDAIGCRFLISTSYPVLIWHPQCEYGPTATTYQRVNTATDYDTAGFPRYLRADGIEDHLVLPYLGLYANNGASVFSASTLLRQSTNSCLLSEGNSADTDSLYCMTRQLASGGNLDSTIVRDDATVMLDTTGSGSALADGTTSVRGFIDTGSNVKLFKNSQQLTSDNYIRSGTVTLNNTIIGGKVSSTNSMFGSFNLYGLIIAKSVLSDGDRRKLEVFLANKAGISV